ncbi:hypothetical protein PV325_001607 [Microctonus aethiopoides]|nr:hypothetical protein PV325_001607 [Microctonus aethiopoides]
MRRRLKRTQKSGRESHLEILRFITIQDTINATQANIQKCAWRVASVCERETVDTCKREDFVYLEDRFAVERRTTSVEKSNSACWFLFWRMWHEAGPAEATTIS